MAEQTVPSKQPQIVRNPDGTIHFQTVPATSDADQSSPFIAKDVPINQSNNTWARIFRPRAMQTTSSSATKLPLIIYFHGGGFVNCSAATKMIHDFCANMAIELSAVIVSVDYRLAPTHRLPAAYDDAMESLHSIKTGQDDWLTAFADFSNCYLMGTSSGANTAYHLGLRATEAVDDLKPLKIQGLILHHPFFGGTKRTNSELRLINDPILPPAATDRAWDLALPIGVDRDHEYCNPTVDGGSDLLYKIKALGWRILVTGCDGDPLIDRQIEVFKMMDGKGVHVASHFVNGDYHSSEILEPSKANSLYLVLKNFI